MNDESKNGLNVSMPVQPMGGGYAYPVGSYGGFGGFGNGFGGDWGWILILFLFAAFGGGMGGFGGFGGWGMDGMFPWLLASNANNQNATNAGFDNLGVSTALSGIQSSVTSGFGDVQLGIAGVNQNICQTGGQITQALNNGFAQAEIAEGNRFSSLTQQLYNNEINSLNRSFAEQTANTQGFNGVQSQLAQCCCDNRLATQGLQTAILQDGSVTRQAIAQGIQSIQDKLCQLELDGVKSDLTATQRENATLQNQLNMAAFRADNVAQTSQLIADNTAQTQYIVNRVAPYPIPAYPVSNPYGYGYGWSGGWNNGGFGPNAFGNVGFGNGSF